MLEITKHDYLKRYLAYWSDIVIRLFAPRGVIVWQFGLLKEEISIFSRIQGTTLIALLITFWTARGEIIEKLKEIENKGWYKAFRRSATWGIVLIALIWSYNFIDEMIWVVSAFFVGSIPSNILVPTHTKYKNKIINAKTRKEKDTD